MALCFVFRQLDKICIVNDIFCGCCTVMWQLRVISLDLLRFLQTTRKSAQSSRPSFCVMVMYTMYYILCCGKWVWFKRLGLYSVAARYICIYCCCKQSLLLNFYVVVKGPYNYRHPMNVSMDANFDNRYWSVVSCPNSSQKRRKRIWWTAYSILVLCVITCRIHVYPTSHL